MVFTDISTTFVGKIYIIMKRIDLFFTLCCFVAFRGLSISAASPNTPDMVQWRQLSQQAEISLITCSPSEDAVFTVYGHTALRIYDPANKIDQVYNYGIFDFSKPDFVYRFAKGETDYVLGTSNFGYFLFEYVSRGSEVYEQVLNLLHREKEALWNALEWNVLPENRVYRYNFFFDNCATRPVAMIENNLQGTVNFMPPVSKLPTFRDIINKCTRYRSWQTFGCDLALGLPTDRMMTQRESFFIPDNVKNAFEMAKITREGVSVPLVKKTNLLAEKDQLPQATPFLMSPVFCFSALFVLILVITIIEWRRKFCYRIVDILLFFSAGIAGCILFFLSFFSVHPSIFPNISLLWLHPLHLFGFILFSIKKLKMPAYWYHFINFAVVIIMSVAWIFVPQHFNIAFIPLIASLLLRSGGVVIRKKYTIG